MQGKTGMAQGKDIEGKEEIEASGDTIVLADAIGYIGEGLHAIARAIERLARAQEGDEPMDDDSDTYLDGTSKGA